MNAPILKQSSIQRLAVQSAKFAQFTASLLLTAGSTIAIASAATLVGEAILTAPNPLYQQQAIAASRSQSETVAEKASPAVVSVQTQDQSFGSGMILQEDGLVLTNVHVVGQNRRVKVVLQDGTQLWGEVVARGEDCVDLALVKVYPQKQLPTLSFAANNSVRLGQPVYAIGNPLGYSGSFTEGVVSRLDAGTVQTSVPLNPGNSGGPLLNADGEIVGVNQRIRSDGRNISFSIDLQQVQAFLQEYRSGALAASVKTHEQPTIQPIAFDHRTTTISGNLGQGSRLHCGDRSFYNAYEFQGKAGQSVMIKMESQAVTPYLALVDPKGEEIAVDSNKPGDNYAIVMKQLPMDGTYRVIANTRDGKQQGKYSLSVSPLTLLREGTLEPGNPSAQGRLYQQYEFQGQTGQSINLMAASPDFDTAVFIVDSNHNLIASNDNMSKTSSNSALSMKIPKTGAYSVVVTSKKQGQAGKFLLMIQ